MKTTLTTNILTSDILLLFATAAKTEKVLQPQRLSADQFADITKDKQKTGVQPSVLGGILSQIYSTSIQTSYCLYKSPNYPVLHEVDQNKPRRVKTQLCFLFMPWIFSKFGFRSWSDSWSETTIKKKDKPCPPCAVLHFGIHCEILAVWLNWVKLWYSENVDSLLYIVRGTWYNIDNSLAHFLHQKLSKHDAELIEAGGKSDFFPCHSLTLQTFLKYPRQRGPRSVYPQPNLLCG